MSVPERFAPPTTGALSSEPVSLGTTAPGQRLPDIEIQPPFMFFHSPASWYVVEGEDGPELLPLLSQIAVEPGIGNTDRFGDPSLMIGKKQSKGWEMIPESAARPADTGDGKGGYLRMTLARRGKTHHTAWSVWRSVAGRATMTTDQPRYLAWLRSLVDRGFVAPADPSIVERMLDEARVRLGRAEQRDTKPGSIAARLAEQARERVTTLEGLSGIEPLPTPDAAPKARRPRKAAPVVDA